MGKVKTRFLGMEEIEKKQKQEQKKRAIEKKVKTPGKHKGGEQVKVVEVGQEALAKMKKAVALAEQTSEAVQSEKKKTKKTKAKVRGKKYQQAKKTVSKSEKLEIAKAIELLKKIKFAKFDESVELHLNTTKDSLKGEVQLPHSLGKTIRVKIVDDKLLDQIEQGKIDFDILVTHPTYMPRLAKLAKILGPKGLMPNPKTGTISDKPQEVAQKFAKGALRWKSEPKAPLIHLMVGKISHGNKELLENIEALIKSIGKSNIKSAYLKTTMSPAVRLRIE